MNESPCPCCRFLPDDLFLPSSEQNFDDNHVEVLSPEVCWERLCAMNDGRPPLIVDTHSHAHLARESQTIYSNEEDFPIVSLTCAVDPSDWESCIRYASESNNRIAAIGVHPWYLESWTDECLDRLRGLLAEHPLCMVGEIGLCKVAKFIRNYPEGKQAALQLQRDVFEKQLKIASHFQRPVSIHCVQQQGVLIDIFKQFGSTVPPVMALHSFTGTAHQARQLLDWEQSLRREEPLLYFGFSHSVNYAMCSSEKSRRQGRDAIRAVPRNRLLAESDVHCNDDVALGTAGAVAYIAWALEEPVETVAALTAKNGLDFLQRLESRRENA